MKRKRQLKKDNASKIKSLVDEVRFYIHLKVVADKLSPLFALMRIEILEFIFRKSSDVNQILKFVVN